MTYKLIFAFLLVCLVTACQTLEERQRSQSLQDTLRSYEATLRWSSGLHAGKFRDPQHEGSETHPQRQRKDIRITHYEVVQGPTMLGDKRAVQTAVIQYVLQENQILREITDQQVWLFDEEQEKWYLSSQVPVFK